jgi:HD-GYP domain-containing protein (c-di-GMP phosphodiesterase class II)
MKHKKNIVRVLISFFGLFFVLAFLFSLFFKPLLGSSLIDISGFSNEEDVVFKTAGKERFFYEKTYELSDKEFSILNQDRDVGILVYRIPGYYYEVEFNGKTVGKVSDSQHKGSNIWNGSNIFILDQANIKEKNVISIRGETASVFNENMFNVFLGRYDKVSKIYTIQKVVFQDYVVLSIGFLIALAMAIVLIKASDDYGEKGYIWMAIGAILFAFYLLDYVNLWSIPISKLIYRKLTIMCLFTSIGCLGIGLGKRFDFTLLKRYSMGLVAVGIAMLFIANSFPSFKTIYSYTSIALVVHQLFILVALFKVRRDISFGHTLTGVACIMILATSYDVYGMINNLGTYKMSIYSVIVLIASVLVISIYHLSSDYLKIQDNASQKEEEVIALKEHMYVDRLSGYHRLKYLEDQMTFKDNVVISVAYTRLDALDAVRNNRGIEASESIMMTTYDIFNNVFESYGDIFIGDNGQIVTVLTGIHTEDAYKMLEMIRLQVMQSEDIRRICGVLPYTITSGLATRLGNEDVLELIRCANMAMLNGEGHGRNQTVIYEKSFSTDDGGDKENHHLMLNFVYTIINTIDTRDRYTSRHSEEVAKYSLMIGECLGLDSDYLDAIKIGSILHDCGKLGVSDFILNKIEPLTEEETKIIRNHPGIGHQLAKQIFTDERILNCIKYHHERIDGKGYPEGLAGDNIPLEARIVAVADAYHAMISSRKYGQVFSHEHAFEELKKQVGKQFDRQIVVTFKQCLMDGEE